MKSASVIEGRVDRAGRRDGLLEAILKHGCWSDMVGIWRVIGGKLIGYVGEGWLLHSRDWGNHRLLRKGVSGLGIGDCSAGGRARCI